MLQEWFHFVDRERQVRVKIDAKVAQLLEEAAELKTWTISQVRNPGPVCSMPCSLQTWSRLAVSLRMPGALGAHVLRAKSLCSTLSDLRLDYNPSEPASAELQPDKAGSAPAYAVPCCHSCRHSWSWCMPMELGQCLDAGCSCMKNELSELMPAASVLLLQVESVRADMEGEIVELVAIIRKKNEDVRELEAKLVNRLRWGIMVLQARNENNVRRQVLLWWR